MLLLMSHATFKDRIPSKDLLTKFDLLPVRRVVQRFPESGAGQTKLEEDYCDEQSNPCQHGIINDFKLMMMMTCFTP